ncbi:MAG: DegT/DnrJ/EryC1/StrS family aminotransferase [Treponema sp.]|jgi:dTDP-4-amino-4,6-dideoxygalactose transaminase|nr:DegT/DnrJ/EryC1/StrS family aminotransferase [Treponema sp.]
MDEAVPFARPFTGKEEEEAVIKVLRSGWLTTGSECLAFEKEFAEFLESKKKSNSAEKTACLAVNSATSGLHLALEACGVGPGDLVLLPSYTFTASAEVIRYLGADPVFVDVAPGTFHLDPKALEKTLEKLPPDKAKAVMPVHFGGLPCDMEAILSIAGKYGLKTVEDAAHSLPSPLPASPHVPEGTFAGASGDIGVFSFYVTKTMTTGEGGMIAVRDMELAKRMSIMRSHGIDRSIWNRYTDTGASWYYEVVAPGFKYNLPDLLAALGRVQLGRIFELLSQREAIAGKYDEAFAGDGHFIIPPSGMGDARHLYPLRINPQKLRISRNEFIEKLKEQGIGVSVHFIPLHTMPYYKTRYNLKDEDFPESLSSFESEISLPIWPGMSGSMIEKVITVVKSLGMKYTK